MNVKILKAEIGSFGKLKNAVYTAGEGINVLSAPNESGKSTLAAFIKFVFYGFAGARAQSISENERKLYSPWSGEPASGSVTVESDGKIYVVERRFLPAGKETVAVTDRATGKTAFTGEIPGEALFGVSEEIFSRTLFFRQLTSPSARDDVIADRLQNIAISADEQVGTARAVQKLTESKNELKNRLNNGMIPKYVKSRDELSAALEASMSARAQANALSERASERASKIAFAESRLTELESERENIEKYEALLKLRSINRLAEEERAAEADYEASASKLKSRDDLNASLRELSTLNSEYVAEKARAAAGAEALNAAESARREAEDALPFTREDARYAESALAKYTRLTAAFFIAAGVLLIAGAVTVAFVSTAGAVLFGAAAVASGVGIGFMIKRSGVPHEVGLGSVGELKRELAGFPAGERRLEELEVRSNELREACEADTERISELKKRLDEGIGRYVDAGGDDYSDTLAVILRLSAESGEKLAVLNAKRALLNAAREGTDAEELAEFARGAHKPERERATVEHEIKFYSQQSKQLSELQHRDEIEIASLMSKSGDPAVIAGKKRACDEKIAELEFKYKAYEAAIQAINESGDYMKSMVAPRISARADEYFKAALDGKYDSLAVDTRMSMSYGEDFRRSCEYMSAGTRDSAYLCLRLALADMLFGGGGVPIVLDDAFVRIDDERLKSMMKALSAAAAKHQIFIFTHGDREKNALSSEGVAFIDTAIRTV